MDSSIRLWNVAQILGDLEAFNNIEEAPTTQTVRKQKAIEFFQVVVKEELSHSLKYQCRQIPLLWLVENGDDTVVGMLPPSRLTLTEYRLPIDDGVLDRLDLNHIKYHLKKIYLCPHLSYIVRQPISSLRNTQHV